MLFKGLFLKSVLFSSFPLRVLSRCYNIIPYRAQVLRLLNEQCGEERSVYMSDEWYVVTNIYFIKNIGKWFEDKHFIFIFQVL